jgi:hypothetical protein
MTTRFEKTEYKLSAEGALNHLFHVSHFLRWRCGVLCNMLDATSNNQFTLVADRAAEINCLNQYSDDRQYSLVCRNTAVKDKPFGICVANKFSYLHAGVPPTPPLVLT